jgi:hypothetical protein
MNTGTNGMPPLTHPTSYIFMRAGTKNTLNGITVMVIPPTICTAPPLISPAVEKGTLNRAGIRAPCTEITFPFWIFRPCSLGGACLLAFFAPDAAFRTPQPEEAEH